jgi:hypothetical protein
MKDFVSICTLTGINETCVCIFSVQLIQRVWRGTLGRRKAEVARDFMRRRNALIPYVVMFQRIYRGNKSRKTYKYVADAIRTMYECRVKHRWDVVSVD